MFILNFAMRFGNPMMGGFGPRPFFPQPFFAPRPFVPFAPAAFQQPIMFAQAGGPMALPPILPTAPSTFPQMYAPLPIPPAVAQMRAGGAPVLPAIGGGGAGVPTINIRVPGAVTIPATATIPALRGGRVVEYRDGNGAGPHRIGIRPAAGGAIQWFDLDDARLTLNAATQSRISSSALLAQQMGLTVRPDGSVIQFRAGGLPPITYEVRANGQLVSAAVRGRPSIAYEYNPGGQPRMFTPAGRPITVVTAGSPLTAAGLPVNTYTYVNAADHTIRIFNPGAGGGAGAWEAPAAPLIPGAAVNGIFANGTFRAGAGLRAGDAFYRIPAGRANAGNFFVLNNAGTQFRIVDAAGNPVGGAAFVNIAGHARETEFAAYRTAIQATRAITGVNPA